MQYVWLLIGVVFVSLGLWSLKNVPGTLAANTTKCVVLGIGAALVVTSLFQEYIPAIPIPSRLLGIMALLGIAIHWFGVELRNRSQFRKTAGKGELVMSLGMIIWGTTGVLLLLSTI